MLNDYIINHFNIGVFVHNFMNKSSIFSLEIDIKDNEFLLFPTFIDEKGDVVEWFEKPQASLKLFHFCEKNLTFLTQSINLIEFKKEFLSNITPNHDKNFIHYLSSYMKEDCYGSLYYLFKKNQLGEDLNNFWGKSIIAYNLYQKLDTSLIKLNKIKAIKI